VPKTNTLRFELLREIISHIIYAACLTRDFLFLYLQIGLYNIISGGHMDSMSALRGSQRRSNRDTGHNSLVKLQYREPLQQSNA
jgi:hypothetical protein